MHPSACMGCLHVDFDHMTHVCTTCRGGDSGRVTDNPPTGFGGQGDSFPSPPKSDSIGSGVTEEGEIAAVLGRMLEQAGRMDAQAVAQVRVTRAMLSGFVLSTQSRK